MGVITHCIVLTDNPVGGVCRAVDKYKTWFIQRITDSDLCVQTSYSHGDLHTVGSPLKPYCMASLETIAVWIIVISSTSAVAISVGLYFGLEPRNNIWIIINRFQNRNIKTEEKTDELKEKNE